MQCGMTVCKRLVSTIVFKFTKTRLASVECPVVGSGAGRNRRKPRGPAQVSDLGPIDQAGPLSFEGRRGAGAPRLISLRSRLRPGTGGKRPCGRWIQRGSRAWSRSGGRRLSRCRCRRCRRAGLSDGGLLRLFLLSRLFLLLGGFLFTCRLFLTSSLQRLLLLF